jgi:hypothetical protein
MRADEDVVTAAAGIVNIPKNVAITNTIETIDLNNLLTLRFMILLPFKIIKIISCSIVT